MRTFVGLFVVPLLVVIMCVGVFVLFGWAAYERRSVADYLSDLRDNRSFFAHRRKQAAYELSKILSANPEALRDDPTAGAELRRLFASTDDLWVRRYLALVLGHVGDDQAVPLLIEGAADEDSQVRIYSLWALGALAEPSSFATLEAALTDTDPGIRKTAAYALGGFEGRPEAIDALVPLVDDPVADVRWNTALALARLGDASAVEVLEQMLDRRLLAQIPDITPQQQEEAMISALRALVSLDAEINGAMLDRLADEDPSLKVRQAAIEARRSRRGEREGDRPALLTDRVAAGTSSAPALGVGEQLACSLQGGGKLRPYPAPHRSRVMPPAAAPPGFSSEPRLGSAPHRSRARPPAAAPPGLTPSERFDYIRAFPANAGSLLPPRQGRV